MRKLLVLAFAAMLVSACLFASNADQNNSGNARTMTVSSPGVSTYGTRMEFTGNRAVLWAQVPDSVAGAGISCQMDSVYPFESELADDVENNSGGTWNIDSIHTYWANWNGFSSWALVPNFRVMLYEDSGTLTMPKMNPSQTVIVEAANYTAYGSGPYQVTLDMTGLGFTVPAGRWWLVVQPSTSFSANGQTGWQTTVGIGNGQEWYQVFELLGIVRWTSASAQGYTGSEAGFILYGEEASSGTTWDFEDGWQGWTHTGPAYPGGWGIGAWNLNGTTWIAPDHGDSSLWVDSDAAGSAGSIRDTAISPVFTDVPGGWLKWGIAFNFISANERLYLIMRGHNGTSWGAWDTLYYYPDGVDVSSRWDSTDVSAWLTYDSLQMGIYYSDSSRWAWYGVFDNIGPVVLPPVTFHDVASFEFLSPAAMVAPSAQDIIGVVRNLGGFDETFDVHLVV
ncbi:hypothetical protein JXA84_01180, partial [candidate division WOR-3 bacterium]|nr:hypothetical protein [candidate division WOR-3 bacterium]